MIAASWMKWIGVGVIGLAVPAVVEARVHHARGLSSKPTTKPATALLSTSHGARKVTTVKHSARRLHARSHKAVALHSVAHKSVKLHARSHGPI